MHARALRYTQCYDFQAISRREKRPLQKLSGQMRVSLLRSMCSAWCIMSNRFAPLLPGKKGDPGRSAVDNRLFVNACLWVLRSGAHWHDLPERYGKWKSVHKHFGRWAAKGVWERIFADLIDDPDNDYVMLNTTLIRAPPTGGGRKGGVRDQALGRSRGGLTTKVHMLAECPRAATQGDDHARPAGRHHHGARTPWRRRCPPCPCRHRLCSNALRASFCSV